MGSPRISLFLHSSPMLNGAVRTKVFLYEKSGIHLGTLHMPVGVFKSICTALVQGGVRIEHSGPFNHFSDGEKK